MAVIFSPCAGAVAKVAGGRGCADSVFAIKFEGATGELTVPITGFAMEQNGNYQFLHTMNDFIYVYSFGNRIGELVLSGMGFVSTCANAESAKLHNLVQFYQDNRLSDNGQLSITLGDLPNATFYAFLTGSRVELQDPKTMVGQWSLRFNIVPKKN